jgi:hypothetical protein
MNIKITKASGVIEDIKPEKLRASLIRSGAEDLQADEIIDRVLREIDPYTSTRKIYRLAQKYLKKLNHPSGLRYSLKRALFRLGPSGYPFEKYYAALLRNFGFETETGRFVQGRCVKHEVDVFAVSDNEISLVECKYHNRQGIAVDVKIAMYIHSRFRDLAPAMATLYPDKMFSGWLVTNTRFTTDAIQYAECNGLKIKSWGYPDSNSLELMIEDRKLYPVTIISGIRSGLVKKLINEDIILLKDLVEMSPAEISKLLSLTDRKAHALKKQAEELCLC